MGRGYSGERWSDGHGVPSTGNDISRSLSLRDIGTDSVERTEQNGHRGLESEVGLSPETASCASGGGGGLCQPCGVQILAQGNRESSKSFNRGIAGVDIHFRKLILAAVWRIYWRGLEMKRPANRRLVW